MTTEPFEFVGHGAAHDDEGHDTMMTAWRSEVWPTGGAAGRKMRSFRSRSVAAASGRKRSWQGSMW
jgi:hypothetical protein